MLKALCDSITEDMGYTDSLGEPALREEVLIHENRKNALVAAPDDVMITNGVSEGIQILFGSLLNPGDKVLIPGPAYPPYTSYARYFDAEPSIYNTIEEDGWLCDIDDIRKKIDDRTRALTINNPTGALIPKKMIREIVDLCGEYDIPIISDEIYDHLILDGKFCSPFEFSDDIPVILLNGFSKMYLVPGWRAGYVVFNDPEGKLVEIEEAMKKCARLRICPNAPIQHACISALTGPQDHVKELVRKLRERRDYVYKRFNDMEGISCTKPDGAFYIFPKITHPAWDDDKKFVLDVLNDCHMLFVHGSGFSEVQGKMHFRSVFLPPIPMMEEALDRLERYLEKK